MDPHFHLSTNQHSPPNKKRLMSSPAQGLLTPDSSPALTASRELVGDQNLSPPVTPTTHMAPASEGKRGKKRKMGERNGDGNGAENGVAADDGLLSKRPRLSSPAAEKLPLQEQGSRVTAVPEQRGMPKDEVASLASSSDKPREEGSEDQQLSLPPDTSTSAEKEDAGKEGGEVATPLPDSLSSQGSAHQTSPPLQMPSHAHTSYYSSLMESSGSELDLGSSSDSSLPSIDLSFKDSVEGDHNINVGGSGGHFVLSFVVYLNAFGLVFCWEVVHVKGFWKRFCSGQPVTSTVCVFSCSL